MRAAARASAFSPETAAHAAVELLGPSRGAEGLKRMQAEAPLVRRQLLERGGAARVRDPGPGSDLGGDTGDRAVGHAEEDEVDAVAVELAPGHAKRRLGLRGVPRAPSRRGPGRRCRSIRSSRWAPVPWRIPGPASLAARGAPAISRRRSTRPWSASPLSFFSPLPVFLVVPFVAFPESRPLRLAPPRSLLACRGFSFFGLSSAWLRLVRLRRLGVRVGAGVGYGSGCRGGGLGGAEGLVVPPLVFPDGACGRGEAEPAATEGAAPPAMTGAGGGGGRGRGRRPRRGRGPRSMEAEPGSAAEPRRPRPPSRSTRAAWETRSSPASGRSPPRAR